MFRMAQDSKRRDENHEQQPSQDGAQANRIGKLAQPLRSVNKKQAGGSNRQEQEPFAERPVEMMRVVGVREAEEKSWWWDVTSGNILSESPEERV